MIEAYILFWYNKWIASGLKGPKTSGTKQTAEWLRTTSQLGMRCCRLWMKERKKRELTEYKKYWAWNQNKRHFSDREDQEEQASSVGRTPTVSETTTTTTTSMPEMRANAIRRSSANDEPEDAACCGCCVS